MKTIKKYSVAPVLPKELKPLNEIVKNLWWSWSQNAINLLRRIDRQLWERYEHNPVKMLGEVSQERLTEIINDDSFMMQFKTVQEEFKTYMEKKKTWYASIKKKGNENMRIAYFSFEYGIHESLPNYSGGLGILSGDHMKSASDIGIPLVAVGLLYRKGYFRQYLNADGWQQEYDTENDLYNLPIKLQTNDNGEPVKIGVQMPGREVKAQIWKANIGRVDIIYLDANIEENSPEDREITAQLYGGDTEMRIKQEMLLGLGGIHALKSMGYDSTVYHMNEGHAAFLALERIRVYMEEGLSFEEATNLVYASSVFTTHTPVPAGNDVFTKELMSKYFSDYVGKLGMDLESLLKWGRVYPEDPNEGFCMTVLALNLSSGSNGVSKLHGHVSRQMWQDIWKEVPYDDLPIKHITNGIHTESWISFEMQGLYDRYLGPRWRTEPINQEIWERVDQIPDAELWRTHERRKERLVAFARRRLRKQLAARGFPNSEVMKADEVLDPDILTIGFARRFATYKRGTLIFRDLERLKSILNDSERPVQIIFAGKAHPHDNGGKDLIRRIAEIGRWNEFRNRIVFIEDYDINVARYLVQGVDIWLNNPRRPLEASGTSGMKVPVNGGINFSVLDGWWDEAYDGTNGWAIGNGEEYEDTEYQDEIESKAIYTILEKELVPMYYDRGRDGLPREFLKRMKNSMRTCNSVFSTGRMVQDYTNMFYVPAHEQFMKLSEASYKKAKDIAKWKENVKAAWAKVAIEDVKSPEESKMIVGTSFDIEAVVNTGGLKPEELNVEIYNGQLTLNEDIENGCAVEMKHEKELEKGKHLFKGKIECQHSGRNGFAVRVMPKHEDLCYKFEMKLLKWF